MAALTVQAITTAGLTPTFAAAAAAGDTAVNGGKTYLRIVNGGAGTPTVTVDSLSNCNQGFDHDVTVTMPGNDELLIGPFPPGRFNAADGTGLQITYSSETDLTIAAISL